MKPSSTTRNLLIQAIGGKNRGNTRKTENLVQKSKHVKVHIHRLSHVLRWGASLSEFFECSLGVKQGGLLQPTDPFVLSGELVGALSPVNHRRLH